MTKTFQNRLRFLAFAIWVAIAMSALSVAAQDAAEETAQDTFAESVQDAPDDTTQETSEDAQIPESQIVATIGPRVLTAQELSREFANRGRSFGPDLAVAQQRLLNTVIAEHWVDQNFAQLAVRDPRVALALQEARRQVLFEVYAQSTFPVEDITEEDIAAYIEANSDIFSDRRSYVYQRAFVIAEDPEQLEAARQALDGTTQSGDAPSDFAPFAERLAATGVEYAILRNWASSENLTPDIRPRLRSMAEDGRRVDILEVESSFDVLILIDTYEDPIDPTQLQDQIADQIQQERYVEHRLALAQSIAEPLIGTLPEVVEEVEVAPTMAVLAAAALAGALFGLVFAMYLSWVQNARLCQEVLENASLGDFRPRLRNNPAFVKFIVFLLVSVLLAEIVAALLFGPVWVRTLEVLAAFFGSIMLGVVLGLLIWRPRKDLTDKTAPIKLRWARRRSLVFTALLLVGGGVLALRPAPVIIVIDYLLFTLS